MSVKIRLRRMGAKKAPFYRVVVADSRYPRDGRFIEEVGYYNPVSDPAEIKIDAEKVTKWIQNGAQPTDTVRDAVQVIVDEPNEEGVVVYHLHVGPDDMGRVIGKQGRIAKAIRTVMRAAAIRNDVKIQVDID